MNTSIFMYDTRFIYVPGWWVQNRYVEGYYRPQQRSDGDWVWVEGSYLEDGTYVWGYWMPTAPGPEGYLWEPGFYDGETYVDGFWRPRYRRGFGWVSAYYDDDGIFHAGYWMPMDAESGYTWVPGWFDGNEWVAGYWVRDDDFRNANVQDYQPADGWDDGWRGVGDGEILDEVQAGEGTPLALPVTVN